MLLEVVGLGEGDRRAIGEYAKVAMKDKHGERSVVRQYEGLINALKAGTSG